MFGTECLAGEGPSFSVPYMRREPLRQEGLFLYRSAALSSGSGFSWFVFVCEGFGHLSTLFWGSREGNSQIFKVFWKFFEDFLAPIKRTD